MQKLNLLGLSLITIGLLTGCGSSSSNKSNADTVETGTGFYVDSAVKGVNYVCGVKSGVTDEDGKFAFEKGKDCTFSIAGIPLRTTKADELVDGTTVFENNAEVARFLQSIDFDGNPANGIQIKTEILEVLNNALAENNSEGVLPTDDTLDTVVSIIDKNVDEFKGRVKTPQEVSEHLKKTQTEVTKNIFAGKTFYVTYYDNNKPVIEKHTINADATEHEWEQISGGNEKGKGSISIDGDIFTFIDDEDTKRIEILQITENYMKIKDADDGEIEKLYFSIEDAKASLDSIGSPTSSTLSALFIGKTYYIASGDSYTDENGNTINNDHVETLNFNADGQKLTDTWEEDGKTINKTFNYNIQGDILNIDGVNGDGDAFAIFFKAPVAETDQYISFSTYSDKIEDGAKFYKTYAAAEAALTSNTPTLSDLKFTTEYLNGKTFYDVSKDYEDHDKDGNKDESIVSTFKFTSSTFKAEQGIVDNPTEVSGKYSIDAHGYIIFNSSEGDLGVRLLKQDTEKLTVCWSDKINELSDDVCYGGEEYFYFDKTKAQESL